MSTIAVRLYLFVAIFVSTLGTFDSPCFAQAGITWPQPVAGAQRGRVVYRRGPFGGVHYKNHYGNGISEYGAGIVHHVIDEVVDVISPQPQSEPAPADESGEERALRRERFNNQIAQEDEQQRRALELLENSRLLAAEFGVGTTLPPEGEERAITPSKRVPKQ